MKKKYFDLSLGTTGEDLYVVKELDVDAIRRDLSELKKRTGIDSIAVVLAHSYTYRDHELQIGEIAKELGLCSLDFAHNLKMNPRNYKTSV